MQETQVPSVGREDSLEKRMATHSSFLAWEIPCTEEPGRIQLMSQFMPPLLFSPWYPYISINRGIHKENVVHIYNGILLSHKKCIWVSSNELDKPRAYSTSEVSQKRKNNWASLVGQLVKNRSTMQETWVWFLSWEDPLEKEMATHSSILAWRVPWTVHGIAKSSF